NRYAILGPETARNDVILQRADDAHNRFAAAGGHIEHLHQPFFFELLQAFVELFVARILQADAAGSLRGKPRKIGKPPGRAGVQRVADREVSGIHQTDDVPGVGDVDGFAIAAEEPVRARGPERLPLAAVREDHVLREATGTDADERD